jgi:hypothetical protein
MFALLGVIKVGPDLRAIGLQEVERGPIRVDFQLTLALLEAAVQALPAAVQSLSWFNAVIEDVAVCFWDVVGSATIAGQDRLVHLGWIEKGIGLDMCSAYLPVH